MCSGSLPPGEAQHTPRVDNGAIIDQALITVPALSFRPPRRFDIAQSKYKNKIKKKWERKEKGSWINVWRALKTENLNFLSRKRKASAASCKFPAYAETATTATEIAERQPVSLAKAASISISISFDSRPPAAGNAFRSAATLSYTI